ncbi:MAG: hypothetical protein HY286_18000 [Planctomycetes bacterium]|nr:hypothetical protein [Planctomycetota bacterium]
MKIKYYHIVIALAAPLVGSCAYLRDRGRDLARVVEFDGGVSTGFQAHAGFSHLLEFGAGYYSGARHGFRDGGFVSVEESRGEFGIPFLYLHEVDQHVASGALAGASVARPLDAGFVRYPLQWFSPQITDREVADFNVSVNFVFIGASFTIKPVAIVDFVFGCVGTDLRRNDLSKYTVDDLVPELHSSDALERKRAAQLIQEITGRRFPEYRVSPSREVFGAEERAAIQQIEETVRVRLGSPSSPRITATAYAAPAARDAMPVPIESTPASRPATVAKQ